MDITLTREQKDRLDAVPNFNGMGEDEDPDAYDRWRDALAEDGGFGDWLAEDVERPY
jgi:hypothetical protein